MGLSLGGIASPVPRKIYAWIGNDRVNGSGSLTKTLVVNGMTNGIRVRVMAWRGLGSPSCDYTIKVVCGGSKYTLESGTNAGYLNSTYYCIKDFQYLYPFDGGFLTHAFNVEDITAIEVFIQPYSGGSADKRMFMIEVMQIDLGTTV
jgi:hypothetical protein